ncbi:MAG: hypothetical protein RL226_1107 [Bacteroidota bacterium]|jgi:DNA-binding NtrC family response regulator
MAKPFKIFIVEDDLWYSEVLEYILKLNPDCDVEKFSTGKAFLQQLHRKPDMVTLDYQLDDTTGLELLKRIRAFDPHLPVVIVSGQKEVATAVELLRAGAFDYIVKDEEAKERIWNAVKNIREKNTLLHQLSELQEEVEQKYDFQNIVGTSTALDKVKKLMAKALTANITVSITGETGTGKEVVAKGIHYHSVRKKKPFVALNVAAIPSELVESELFGYEKGAFTGADSTRVGKFEEAHEGTLFLDEIGEMPAAMQSKLLRVLQEKEIQRIGGNKTIPIDVRLIVATHRNLADQVRAGAFREDLYYRLLGLPIELPPLRERGNDVLLLARHFLDDFARENKLGKIEISSDARDKLLRYPFPGNVRELKAVVELAAVMCNDKTVQSDDLTFGSTRDVNGLIFEERTLEDYSCLIIRQFLEKYDNNVIAVAQKLDIGKSTIYRMMKSGKL